MKETGIIMSGNHPRQILEGIKTMTRRTWGLEKINKAPDDWYISGFNTFQWYFCNKTDGQVVSIKCPYGQVGDRLWVKETWAIDNCGSHVPLTIEHWPEGWPVARLRYPATDPAPIPPELADDSKKPYWWNKRPSIFMPRWASRILLEITEVRAERLQEITHDDCIREGIVAQIPDWHFKTLTDYVDYVKKQYATLWNSLNAKKYPWSANNWVWPISFKELKEE